MISSVHAIVFDSLSLRLLMLPRMRAINIAFPWVADLGPNNILELLTEVRETNVYNSYATFIGRGCEKSLQSASLTYILLNTWIRPEARLFILHYADRILSLCSIAFAAIPGLLPGLHRADLKRQT